MSEPRHGLTLEAELRRGSTREHVFDLLTKPDALVRWWGPRGFTTPEAEVDLSAGGDYRFTMQPPEGEAFHLWVGSSRSSRRACSVTPSSGRNQSPTTGKQSSSCPCAPWVTQRSCRCRTATSRPRNAWRYIEAGGRMLLRSCGHSRGPTTCPSWTSTGSASPRHATTSGARYAVTSTPPWASEPATRWPGSWGPSRARASRSSEKSRGNSSAWSADTASPAIGWCSSSPTSQPGRRS